MAGIAGIYCADGRPADVAELKRMVAAVAHRGPDGIGYWNAGPVALAHLQFCTTPESLEERQPLVSPGEEACLVWNGRVDNREELMAALESAGARLFDRTDAGLALAAYLAWGAECVQKIVGDFALAVWDARHKRLWCARDYIGIRPFYYFWDGKTFLFGPEIRALLEHPLVSLKINEGMVGEYLANAITSRDETLYADIRRLSSGSALTIDGPGSLRIESWWEPELSLLDYGTDEEYAEPFRKLLDQSIRGRMRCNTAWGIQLSGGLDSSSIAVSARAVLDAEGAGDSEILTFSVACPGKPWDESEDIAAVVEKAKLTPEFVLPMRADLEFFRERANFFRDYPGSPNGEPMFLPMADAAKGKGVRVFLSGIGGDEWLDGNPAYYTDLVRRLARPGAVRELIHRLRFDWRNSGGSRSWMVFLMRRLIVAGAPEWAHARRRRMRLERDGILSREYLLRTRLIERLSAGPERRLRRFSTRAQRAIFHLVTGGQESLVLEWNDRDAACAGMEFRFPFFDRRLVEFCIRIPEDQRQRGSEWKRMLRNSMRGRLPDRIRTKTAKADFTELFESVFYAAPALARRQSLTVKEHTDWCDPLRLEQRIAAASHPDNPGSPGAWTLWRMLGIDLWLESVLSSGGEVRA